jgi:L-rhamnose isomerase
MAEVTPEQRIDEALDIVLKASGSALKNYTTPLTLDRMREAMRKIMSESYISGSNDNFKAMQKQRRQH